MNDEKYSLTYFDAYGEKHRAHFETHEYHSLMEFLFDKYIEEWGDCKGRAWCGTCHIQIIKGKISEKMDEDEKHTLSLQNDYGQHSRLACQIPLTKELDGLVFRIVTEI